MLLETIKIMNGNALFLEYHQERINYSRRILLNLQNDIPLKKMIKAPTQQGIYKCRVIYSQIIDTIEYSRYQARHFKTFQMVESDDIVYNFKYINRAHLNRLLRLKGQADDILIIKKGFITDTSIANIAFWYQNQWITPSTPLLKGTTRARLLKEHKIVAAPIRLNDVKKCSQIALMNALLGFYIIKDCILYPPQ